MLYRLTMCEPSRTELVLLWLLTCVMFVTVIVQFKHYSSEVDNFGDSSSYMAAASGIRKGDFRDIQVKQFWGVSYLAAPLSFLMGGSDRSSLLLICGASSLAAVLLAQQLWGGWIAGLFAILNFAWLQTSYLGGAEPLFMALLFASFWAMRHERWILASGLAALATVTRPVGVFALVALGTALLMKRKYQELALCTGLALIIGVLYILPFWVYFGDPLYQVHRYKTNDWQSASPIGLPFQAIGHSFAYDQQPWTNVILTGGWVVFVLIGLLAMARDGFRQYVREHRPEGLFALLYIAFLFTYNSSIWARTDIVRFAIPSLPFVLLSLKDWVPRSRVLLYGLGALSGVLAACSAIGIRNVFPILR